MKDSQMLYGKSITWFEFDGTKSSVIVSGCASPDEAEKAALRMAKESGWTPPQWWQFWRYGEAYRSDR